MNSKNKKTISLLLGGFIALIIIGCSAPVENNSNATPQSVETSPTEPIPHTPTEEFTPTVKPTKTETPSPTPTEMRKSDAEYQQMREELNNLNGILRLLESPNGLKTNFLIDDGSFEVKKLKEYIGYFLELSCNKPDLLVGIEFEPFLLENNTGANWDAGIPGENLGIKVEDCEYTKETLEILEENGTMIALTHPVFEPEASESLTSLFPGIKIPASGYYHNGISSQTGYKDLAWYSGMVYGIKDYQTFTFAVSERFSDSVNPDDHFKFHVAEFRQNVLSFSIPIDSNGNMIFSKIMLLPKDITPNEIENMITKGTVAHVGLFSNKIWFSSEQLSE